MEKKIVIKASWLGSMDYCEYKWYLENVMGVPLPVTKAMTVGTNKHAKKEAEFLEVATPTTMQEFLKSTKYTITKEITLSKEFDDFILIGKLDELAIDAQNVYVIDDKPRAYPWPGVKLQLYAYCVLFEENFKGLNKKIIAVLRNRDTNDEVWNNKFTDTERSKTFEVLNRIKSLFEQKVEPIPSTNPRKCQACVLHKQKKCEHSAANNEQSN